MHIFQAKVLGRFVVLLGMVPLLAVAGCGGPATATVKGKVTYKGTALKGGRVVFKSTEGKGQGGGVILEDGNYTADNVPTGKVQIAVVTSHLSGKGTTGMAYKPPEGAEKGANYKPPTGRTKNYREIPPKYEDPATADLPYTVEGGENEKNINLE